MDNKLCANPSTYKTLVMEGEFLLPMVPRPIIFPLWFPPNLTSPPDLSSRLWNIDFLPVMCREHPESKFHDWCFNCVVKDIYNIIYFLPRYSHLFGSFGVSVPRVLFELMSSMKFFRKGSVFN